MNTLFCRHNRFTAECPICSKDSVLSRAPAERSKPARSGSAKPRGGVRRGPAAAAAVTRYPHVSVGPLERDARFYEVRLERVPGGLRLGDWRSGELERHAPVLGASALRELIDDARGHGIVGFDLPEAEAPAAAEGSAASPGRAGDMREELRLERLPEPGMVRVARWIYWPGDDRWELQDAPVMLPEPRFEQVLSEAARRGLI